MSKTYEPIIEGLIALGRISADPENWDGSFLHSLQHCQDLFQRLGIEAELIQGEKGVQIRYADRQRANTRMVQALVGGRDLSGNLLYAGDFSLLGALTGRTL